MSKHTCVDFVALGHLHVEDHRCIQPNGKVPISATEDISVLIELTRRRRMARCWEYR